MSSRRAVVILNPGSGRPHRRARLERRLRAALVQVGLDADIVPSSGDDIAPNTRHALAQGADLVVAAGGDGTASAVADILAGTDAAMGVLPLGTLNHFAKDVGVPTRLEDAVYTLRRGVPRRIDVGSVNGRTFVNNVSIGAYPSVVRRRSQLRRRFGWGKWSAMVWALLSVSRRYPLVRLDLEADLHREPIRSPFLFVGNNRYDLVLLSAGRRERLDGGELCVHFANHSGRLGITRMLLRSAVGRLEADRDFETVVRRRVTVRSQRTRVRAAIDGEVHRLAPPLRFESRPRALRVILPEATP